MNSMYNVHFIQHDKLTQAVLDEIIKVKTVAWPFSYDQQCEWMTNNLKNSDVHVLLFDGEKVIAYLNLIKIEMEIDSVKLKGFGIGNVCAIEKGKGWGKELMLKVNQYLHENNDVGLLFCKDKLMKFYSENNWTLVTDQQLEISNINSQIYTFAYNIPKNFKLLQYEGILF
ncbi:GNAT family N-acetyltransferase [Chryseobacterium formosus]|uniref:GNAT family N-acetyltransferase n=1 Tax=Chryseobacterium formosus TaxID=1537363 RepID=A0ABT3XN24_9FLAO|nr:GNAT family N-acetyltransferase [Chryseobacterium formosus]MCX8523529.1 GNAT family N-acetyltransferase [Chryseobacterium formosus]